MSMNVWAACMHMYHMCGWCPQRPRDGIANAVPLELELDMVMRQHVGSEKLKPGPQQQRLLPSELSL